MLIDKSESGSNICLDSCPRLERTYATKQSQQDSEKELTEIILKRGYTLINNYNKEVLGGYGSYSEQILIFENENRIDRYTNLPDIISLNYPDTNIYLPQKSWPLMSDGATIVIITN